ncbi:hypothetical protein MPER_14887, partial [Moniliophthora perniciosa FA553]
EMYMKYMISQILQPSTCAPDYGYGSTSMKLYSFNDLLNLTSLGKTWALLRIQWWGGWAENEDVGTLTRYLLDELKRYEASHSDALRP